MLATKIATCLLGLGLLFPITASFWLMIRYRPMTEAEVQKTLDAALTQVKTEIDSQVVPGYLGAMSAKVEIRDELTLPFFAQRFWLFTPCAWVGVAGFTCCLLIIGLWIYSSFIPSVAGSGGYGRSGEDEASSHGSSGPDQLMIDDSSGRESRIIHLDDPK